MSAYSQLTEIFMNLNNIRHAITFLQWDQLVMMPPGGNDNRSKAIAELTATHHERLTSSQVPELIQEAREQPQDKEKRTSLLEMERTYKQAACLPSDLVKRKSLAGSHCEHCWRSQRKENDWTSFLKNFEEVVQLSREEAHARQESSPAPVQTPYDAMLDLYCTGDSSERIQAIFDVLKSELPELIQQISSHQGPKYDGLNGPFSIKQQKKLNQRLMQSMGFDFQKGRLDVSAHPFSTGDKGDQRITTRFSNNDFLEALLATAHETGHASYESGLPKKWQGLPIGTARNMCIHESQSLLFEKHLFLSQPFFSFFINEIHSHFPQTSNLTPVQLWSICSYVEPSLIRVEADEATYPMHVILRFEIERDLINSKIEAKDIPELWNEKMMTYLGIHTKGNYRNGCLQDIHWTDGSFGYFPSYTMGALNSAQLFAAFTEEHPDWHDMFANGHINRLREWLQKKVWSKASSMESQEIIVHATGKETNASCFLQHLRSRYLQ